VHIWCGDVGSGEEDAPRGREQFAGEGARNVGAGARHAGRMLGGGGCAHGGGDWGGTRVVVGGHGCARWRRVRGRLRAWRGAVARMAVGVGAGRGGGCAHGRVPVAMGAGAAAGEEAIGRFRMEAELAIGRLRWTRRHGCASLHY
jgi:hypothetical protein